MPLWLVCLVTAMVSAANWRWGYSVGRAHGREWGARR